MLARAPSSVSEVPGMNESQVHELLAQSLLESSDSASSYALTECISWYKPTTVNRISLSCWTRTLLKVGAVADQIRVATTELCACLFDRLLRRDKGKVHIAVVA